MGEEQGSATTQPAGQSLAEINSNFLQSRADRLNVALQTALASKDKPTQKPGSAGSTATAKPSKPAAGKATAQTAPAAESVSIAPAADESGDAAEEPATATSAPDDSQSDDDSTGADDDSDNSQALAPELQPLAELGKKKDLRALEKALGLPEGHLGVKNGDYAAYRRRESEVTEREQAVVTNEHKLIQRFGPPAALIEKANAGDLRAYADLIEKTTSVPIDTFVEFWVKNVTKLDPETIRLRRENEELRRGRAPEKQDEQKPVKVTAESAAASADKYIQEEAGNHPAFKLEGAKEGVRKIWLASLNPKTKGFNLTPQQAASEFVKQRRAQIERESWITAGNKPPQTPRTRTRSRQGAGHTRAPSTPPTREQLIERGAAAWRAQKQRDDAARGR